MRQTKRTRQIADMIQRDLSELIRKEIREPLGFVTIAGVEVSTDLKIARVFISIFGDDDEKEKSMEVLERHRKQLRGGLAARLKIRHTPDLEFRLDKTAERAGRIEEILHEVLPAKTTDESEEGDGDE